MRFNYFARVPNENPMCDDEQAVKIMRKVRWLFDTFSCRIQSQNIPWKYRNNLRR